MQQLIYPFCLMLMLCACSGMGQTATQEENLMNKARQAFFRTEHREAFDIFERVWNDERLKTKDRAQAGRKMAKMKWRFYNQPHKAMTLLEEVVLLGEDMSEAHLLRARILSDLGRADEAIAWTEKAIGSVTSDTEMYEAVMAHGRQLFNRVEQSIMNDGRARNAHLEAMQKTYGTLQSWMNLKLGDVKVAELNLAYALLLGKGERAFEAWMAYYRHTDLTDVHPSLLTNPARFKEALRQYNGEGSPEAEVIRMVKGLAESGFYELAALMKTWHLGPNAHEDERLNEIVAYYQYRQGIAALALDYYRELIQDRTGYAAFNEDINDLGRKLWRKLSWTDEQPAFSTQRFRPEIRKRFKGYLARFTSGNYYGVHLGQVVLDDRRIIRQYNEEAGFRYYLLDHMVSNGFNSWYGDGDNEVGGWAPGKGSFLQVRTTMTTAPIELWQITTDPKERAEVNENIAEWIKEDEVLVRKDPYAYLQGLKYRLMKRELDGILDSLKAAGLKDEKLRFAFISRVETIMEGSAIYAHEGRHAIDIKNNYSTVTTELEFTAKLSEIYFSERPFLSIQTILSTNIGHSTPHGQANLRVLKGLVNWMEVHQDEIDGFDQNRPTQLQLDKLTSSQLKAAVRSMDPMAN